ncbi:MAG: hypothetical protein L3J32_09430 [Rhizobiaceae bacterium]|nr:hypothetical protein [Rhizobiaceae bacterium]
MFGNFILRFIMITIGFMFAIVAAGMFIGFGFYNEILTTGPLLDSWEEEFFGLLSLGVGFASIALIGAYATGVAAILIALAEMMRWQGLIANLVLGGFCAAILSLGSGNSDVSDGAFIVALSAGFIGGFVYWLIAGRNAGNWLGPIDVEPSKS